MLPFNHTRITQMRIVAICAFSILISLVGCKQDSAKPQANTETKKVNPKTEGVANNVNITKPEAVFDPSLPDMCTYITPEILANILGKPVGEITSKDGSNVKNPKSRNCFYKLLNQEPINAGVMVSAELNPLPDEISSYHSTSIKSKKTIGENSMQGSKPHVYKDFPGIGDDGAYSYELGRYVWRVGEEITFMVAFNTNYSEAKQKKIARQIAEKIMEAYNKK